MTFKTNEKNDFFYFLTFIDKIINYNGYFICGMSNSKNRQSLMFTEK